MSRLAAIIRSCAELVLLLAMATLSGGLVLVLVPYIWIREAVSPVMRCEEMEWLDG